MNWNDLVFFVGLFFGLYGSGRLTLETYHKAPYKQKVTSMVLIILSSLSMALVFPYL